MADGGAMWAQMNAGPADPIRSFTAGASLAAQMDSIRQATQAASFNNTLQLLKLQEAKTDRADRLMLANRELELSAFNAETNRINALRPTRSSGYGGSGSLQNLIQLPDGSMGVDLGPADGSENVPQGTILADDVNIPEGGAYEGIAPLGASSDIPQQMPTSGEGDISGPPMSQRVPQGGGLTLPIQGGNNGSNPLLPSPSGAAPAASGGEIVNINGRMVKRLPPNTSITQRGPGFSMTTRTPTSTKPKEVPQQDWNTMAQLMKLGGLELTGVDGFDSNGRPQPKFEKPKEKDAKALYDFDQLDEETRAKITDSFKRVAFPVPPEGFTDVEKMAAVGIQLPPDADPSAIEAAGAKMTPELWTRGYNILREKALANREQAVMEHSALLTSVAGKRVTPEEVLKMLPDYEPPADTRQGNVGTTMQKMTETGDSAATPSGLLKAGNLDPLNRKVLQNKDGTSSTASTISIGTDEGEVLIPTVVDGVRLSEKEAIEHYKKTKEHFGVFATPQDANTYASQLHNKMEASVTRPKLSPEERRAIGTKAQAARVRFAHSGMKDTAADAEARALQKQLDDDGAGPSRAASAAAPAPGVPPAANAQPPTGPIRSYAEMQTLRKEEEQKPLKQEDAKQWQSAKNEALDMIEKAAKKSGVPPQSILASIARGGADKHSALSLAGVWDEFKGKDRYAFKRKASTPGMNQVTWEEVIESLADSGDLLQERYGITPEQLRAGGGQARRDLYK